MTRQRHRRTGRLPVALVVVGLNTFLPAMAVALSLTDNTACAVAVQPFDSNDAEGAREVLLLVKNTMEALDTDHMNAGEPGIIANLSDQGFTNLALAAVERCREEPKTTIRDSAAFVYMGVREAQLSIGLTR